MKRFFKNRKGFSLAEVLLVVAMVVALGAVAFVSVISYMRSMNQLERDGIAKEIFVAAQNHLSMAESQGFLGKGDDTYGAAGDADADAGKTVYYYVVGGQRGDSTSPDDMDSLLSLMLPFASVDETVRLGGSYIIRYQTSPALVLDVFYSTKSGTRFGHDYAAGEYATLIDNYRDTTDPTGGTVSKKMERRKYTDGSILGYYGGVEASGLTVGAALNTPDLQIINAETLRVIVIDPNADNSEASLRLVIEGAVSGSKRYIDLTPGSALSYVSYDSAAGQYTVVLDDITAPGGHFAQLFCSGTGSEENLIPGENITVKAVAYSKTVLTNIAESAAKPTNSLFGDDSDIDTAEIANFRHLENLDAAISALDKNDSGSGLDITRAVQTTDLDWADFLNKTRGASTQIVPISGDASAAGTYLPVTPSHQGSGLTNVALDYDGQGGRISGVRVSTAGDAGLFAGLISGSSVQDLELIDFDVEATGSGNAGALAGSLSGTTISNVLARNSATSGGDAALEITAASGNAGGLAGSVTGGSVAYSAAAVYVQSESGSAGGLIGSLSGGSVTYSYAGGHTLNGAYTADTTANAAGRINVIGGSNAGGLIGLSSGATVGQTYATCSASGSLAGGLIGSDTGSTVSGSYATGLVSGSTAAGTVAGSVDGTALSGTRYFSIVSGGLAALGTGTYSGAAPTALDATAESYNAFVLAGGAMADAYPYDAKLLSSFGGKYDLPAVTDDGSYFVSAHYGDWPAPETLVVNIPD